MKILIKYLQCGHLEKDKMGKRAYLYIRVTKFKDIAQKIIPIFLKYLIIGIKLRDFKDFCKVASMMKDKKDLTKEGLEKIKKKIKGGMNRERK